ncbi:hypothetical protein BGX21_009235 [Mortierella sp. AD011]|nr:hypothetical protein BGX20_005255 [Mortierella sp. AD010]KAF9402662.1 hypothetical protein BGX21_009235 [Mortierella sp. AD011]
MDEYLQCKSDTKSSSSKDKMDLTADGWGVEWSMMSTMTWSYENTKQVLQSGAERRPGTQSHAGLMK